MHGHWQIPGRAGRRTGARGFALGAAAVLLLAAGLAGFAYDRGYDPGAYGRALDHHAAGRLAPARTLYGRLAGRGHPGAAMHMALMHLTGKGAALDPGAALDWLARAEAGGLAEAAFQQGELLQKAALAMVRAPGATDGDTRQYAVFRSYAIEPDPPAALAAYRRAAEAGHREAQFQYAAALEWGRGVAPDRDAARGWYRRAAAAGHAEAAEAATRIERGPLAPAATGDEPDDDAPPKAD